MKLKFRHKVFLAFLFNSVAVVVCMLWIGRAIAHRNFEQYIQKVEMQRLDSLVELLSQEFGRTETWAPVLGDWSRWLERVRIGPGFPPPDLERGMPPPQPFVAREPPFIGPPPPPPHDPGNLGQRLVLFDADKRPLTDTEPSATDGAQMRPIEVGGKVVGWLGIARRDGPMHPLDLEFLRHQSEAFTMTGAVALLVALLVTMVFSRHLLAPVKELAEGTRALSSRRFETRLAVRSRDEFGQLASDFNAMAQALERYEQMRRQWIADIAHELRTPLAILRGEIEAMQDGVKALDPEALDSLHGEVLHMSRIVQDLHDLSLLESESADGERSALNPLEVLEETLRAFQTRLEARAMAIELQASGERPVRVLADAGRLKQLFANVLENTLRYAHSPGRLTVTHECSAGWLSIHLEDSGPGVPEPCLERLFDRLYRVDKARSRSQGGSGLGLAICKGIVERFGGRIEASNGSAGGLRITVVLPVLGAEKEGR